MNQVWSPLECNEPDLRLWSLNVIALLHSENEKMMEFGVACLGMYSSKYRPDIFWHVGSTIDGANVPFYVVFS